ncbi:MFS transporter [Streptomyces sp. NBC_01384]|uniref:MFS transporter n=1 Tax=Streptomyces sp. NBC_01384 TaxID=2903847 RepID=UPI0032544823
MTEPDTAPPVERRPAWLTRNVRVLCGVSFLQDAASELLYPILPIFLTVVLGAPPVAVGAIEGAAEGAASITKVAAGRLADRFARRPLIGAGYGLAAVGKLLIALATAWPLVLVARVTDRLGKGLRGAPRDALLVEGIPSGQRGRVFGLHRAADTAGAVVGPLVGLVLYEAFDHRLRPLQGTAQSLYQGATGAAVLLAGLWAGLLWGTDGHLPLLISGSVAFALAGAFPAIARWRTEAR